MYRERTWAPMWVFALLWTACLAGAAAAGYDLFLQSFDAPGDPSFLLKARLAVGGVLLFPALITLLFLRLDVEVRPDQLFIAFGPLHLVRKRIRLADIETARALTYRPLKEFGGWGIRPRGFRTAWTIRGNQAVKVALKSGNEVYVGSRFPQRLEERIRAAMRAGRSGGAGR